MFAITGTMSWDPSEHDALAEVLASLAEASQSEAGNVAYVWSADIRQPGTFHIYEHWASEETFNAHCAGDAYNAFMSGWMPKIKAVSAHRHEISGSTSLTG